MNNLKVTAIFVCTFSFLVPAGRTTYARDYSGVIKLKSIDSEYSRIKAGDRPVSSILGCLSIKIEGCVRYVPKRRGDEIKLVKTDDAESRRIRGLLSRFINMHLKDSPGCFIGPDCRWQLVVDCDEACGVKLGGRVVVADLPSPGSMKGMDVSGAGEESVLVKGTFYLINTGTGELCLHGSATGVGAVVDTAIDDFAQKLVERFSGLLASVS